MISWAPRDLRALVDTVERRADEEKGPEAEAEGAAAAALSMRRWRLEAAAAFDFFAADDGRAQSLLASAGELPAPPRASTVVACIVGVLPARREGANSARKGVSDRENGSRESQRERASKRRA